MKQFKSWAWRCLISAFRTLVYEVCPLSLGIRLWGRFSTLYLNDYQASESQFVTSIVDFVFSIKESNKLWTAQFEFEETLFFLFDVLLCLAGFRYTNKGRNQVHESKLYRI